MRAGRYQADRIAVTGLIIFAANTPTHRFACIELDRARAAARQASDTREIVSPSQQPGGATVSVTLTHRNECERTGDWTLVRRTLGLRAFGMNVVDVPPGGQIPEHDEIDRDQEEVFYVLGGEPTIVVDGEEHTAPVGTFVRLDPQHARTVRNYSDEPASVLIVSAPRSSGYEPMEWA
jgi:quercetin dioxygenase-like cupin family protein